MTTFSVLVVVFVSVLVLVFVSNKFLLNPPTHGLGHESSMVQSLTLSLSLSLFHTCMYNHVWERCTPKNEREARSGLIISALPAVVYNEYQSHMYSQNLTKGEGSGDIGQMRLTLIINKHVIHVDIHLRFETMNNTA